MLVPTTWVTPLEGNEDVEGTQGTAAELSSKAELHQQSSSHTDCNPGTQGFLRHRRGTEAQDKGTWSQGGNRPLKSPVGLAEPPASLLLSKPLLCPQRLPTANPRHGSDTVPAKGSSSLEP